MSRWGDILKARAERDGGMGPWGEWQGVPGTAAVQVRVRRSHPSPQAVSYRWGFQFRSVLPRPLSFEFRLGMVRDGPFDQVVRGLEPGRVVSGTVVLPTAGPVWVDARLLPDRPAAR